MDANINFSALKDDSKNLKEFLNRWRTYDQKPEKENQENYISIFNRFNEALVKFFDEKKEQDLDGRNEQGAIEFKLFMIERIFYAMNFRKDNRELQKKFYKLMRKYLKNETEEIGRNKYFIYNTHLEKINEQYLRNLNELMICLNDNLGRIKDVWEINLNGKAEKTKIRNSLDIFYIYASIITSYYRNLGQNRNEKLDLNIINNEYTLELRHQEEYLINNLKKVIEFSKEVQKEPIDNNYKGIILEKFLIFLHQSFMLFLRMKAVKAIKITKEESEIMCDSCHFIIKNATNNGLIDVGLKFFWELITFTNYSQQEENYFYKELYKNWKKYFDFELLLKNKTRSETKINLVLNYFIKFYNFCFKENGSSLMIFKNLHNDIQNDNYNMIKKLIEKLNDFEINLDNKVNIINLIFCFLSFEKDKLSFDDLYFILNEMMNFFKIFYSLNLKDEHIGTFLKEEKLIQKENYQKDMLKINLENNEQLNLLYKRYNLNSIFYALTKSKYDKYIYIKDMKHLYGILKSIPAQQNQQQHYSSHDVIEKLISLFKNLIKNNSKISSDEYGKSIIIDKIANSLCKIFFYYFYIYEKLKSNHQVHDPPSEQNKILDLYINAFTEEEDNNEFLVPIFTKLMPYIFELYKYGLKICPVKSCISARLVHNIFKNIKKEKNKEKVFLIYFEFFSLKIFETGNPKEIFNPEMNNIANSNSIILNESINNITILKSIFFNLLECISDKDQFKNLIIPLIIDILYLSKNSEYYGNYIYILRCFFKYLKTAISQFNNNMIQDDARQKKKKLSDEFNIEIHYILYAIIKYLVNIKEKAPFFNEMITEIIMILPVKQRFLIEIPHLIFPSLVDNLVSGNENIQLNLMNLENWMGVYIKNAESVVPFIQQYLSKITDLLSANLLSSGNINICLASLKWLSKLGGKGRNYFKEKRIISKTCPMQILSMKLKEKNENRSMDFILDYIIDIDIDNCINWSSKTMHKKNATAADKKLIFNYVEIYKNCLSAFFHKKIDYNYILEIKKNIINGKKDFNEKEFNSDFSFRQMNDKNSKIKINNFFRKKEHFIIGKIITGYFLINSSYIQIQNLQKDAFFSENDLMQFISNYFLMILLSKEKNNKNMLLFEQDPILFLDEIIQFLFSSHPTIIKNTNVQLTEYSLKIINNVIDSINKFFDYDNNIIKNLEIVDIIYMKFLNCCYISESPKIDLGLMLIKVLLQKFDKCINFKYLKYFFRCISSVTSNYSNIVNIQFKKACNNLVEVVDYLINIFIINDPNYDLLTENIFDNEMIIEDNTNKDLIHNTKNNFLMLFEFVKYCFDEIVEKIDTDNNYTRNVGVYLIEKIIGKLPRMKYLIPYLFQLDINTFNIKDFLSFFKKTKNQINYRNILYNANNNIVEGNIENKNIENNECILPNFEKKKIYKKLNNIFNTLTKKLGLRENSFTYLITNSDALNNIFNICPCLIEEFIFSNNSDKENNKVELYLEVIQCLYFNILISYYNYCQISIYIRDFTETFKSKLVYLFMEQSLVEKNLDHNYEIKLENGEKRILKNEVPDEYIKYIEKYVNENEIYRNEVNTRDHIVSEIFENLNLRINMVLNYIKLLDKMFIKFKHYFTKEKRTEKEFSIYTSVKQRATQLIFLQILNLHTASIIKQSSKFMCDIFKEDMNLKEEIFNKNSNRITKLINLIDIVKIRQSNCAIIQDMISDLQKEHMTALIIISKSMGLNDSMKKNLMQCKKHFENISKEEFENSQIVLFYGYVSIFLYVNISPKDPNEGDFINSIFDQILRRFEERLVFPSKNLLNFTRTKYKGTVMKFITKYRKAFSKFIIGKSEIKNNRSEIENKCITELIKTVLEDDKNTLICETLFKEITNEFKNNIIKKKDYNEDLLFKIYQLLRICKIISKYLRIYLKSTSLLKVIDEYIKSMIKHYENLENQRQNNNDEKIKIKSLYQKIFKTWIKLHIFYIEVFLDKKFSLDSLFFCVSTPCVSTISKNKIDFVLTYQFNFTDLRNFEKNYISIMNSFVTLDEGARKYFDLYVDKLIIPLMINYYKSLNFFLCYNVSINKEILEIEKKENDNENNINNNIDIEEEKIDEKKIILDEEYLINTLYKLTSRLVKIKFKKVKKEEYKYKLLCIIIILYKEYLSRKKINKDHNEKIRAIHNNITSMLYYSPFYEKETQVLFWRIYLFFGICLFTDQNDKELKKNLEIIYNFSKIFNDEYTEIQNLTYELILPYSNNDESLYNLFYQHTKENGNYGINFLKIILKFPSILNYCSDKVTKELLNNMYDMLGRIKNLANNKKIFLQAIGLFTLYISKIRNKNSTNDEIEKNKHNLESANFTITYRFYRYILQIINQEPEGLDTLKRLLYYFREICNNLNKNNFNIDFKFEELSKLIHVHIQMLRIYFFYFGYEFLYANKNNVEHYFSVNRYMIDNNVNHRIFNDFTLILRLLSDQEILYKLNTKEKIHDIYIIDFKRNLMNKFKDLIKDRNFMKDKITNYEINNFFINTNKLNETNENIVKRVQKYLIDKKYYQDANPNAQNNNNINNQQIIINNPVAQQLPTLSSTDAQSDNSNRNIQQIYIQRAQVQQPPQVQITQEKWMESFNIYYFKNFIFYRKYCEDFYSSIDSMISLINNNSINLQVLNNTNIEINELRLDLENKRKSKQENKEFIYQCTFAYFENFYFFTLFFLQEYHSFYKKSCYYNNSITKEIKEYFLSSHNFFYNLRDYEDLSKIKEEQIELLLNEKDKEREVNNKFTKKYLFYILCIYPDMILSSFLFFFRCEEIMEKYYSLLLELFLYTYRYFRDKFYDPLLEYLVKIIMTNKTLKNKYEEKNNFMLKFLKSYDQLTMYKIIKTSENIILIFKNYLEDYLNEPYTNKKDNNILKSLRIILFIIAKFELKNRKEIFELIKNYIGNNLIDALKWIFSYYDENEIDYYIYFETIPLSIDFFLSFFDENTKLIMNENNFSKFKNLNKFSDENNINMDIEESLDNNNIESNQDMEKYDKNQFIKKMVDSCNLITKDKKVSDLLDPIRAIITSENSSYYKIFVVIFTQIWKMLSMSEREILNMYINEFFYKYAAKQKDKNNCIMAISLLLGAFSQCSPMIYIKPLIIQSLIPYQNFWSTHILYLENLLINGIDIPSTYNSLISIFNSLKEDGLCNGLKYYFSDNKFAKEGYSELQAGNYLNAENIFYECFEKLNKDILAKIDNINVDNFNLEDENLELFNELSSWEEGLLDCYEKNDNWSNVIELGERMNNNDLKLKGLWHYGNEKWQSLDDFVKTIPQYLKSERTNERNLERNNLKNSYIIQINEIYSIFKKLIEDNNNEININNKCQTTCMKCIQNIYQNFSTLHPKNLEIIDYYYFLIFQLAVESWESTNTLNEIIKKLRDNNNSQFNFKDNLLLWRERLPHYCEGFNALRNVLEPRNYLFKSLQYLVNNRGGDLARFLPHYSDKVWTDMIYMKYARKLGLIETFYEKKSLFEEEHKDMIKLYPYEIYMKEIECIKLIRNNTYNYDLGIKICDQAIYKFRDSIDESNKDFVDYICNNLKRHKAYFYYKKGSIINAHNLFIEASVFKNKQSTDYHLYNDWGEMCEEIAKLTKNSEECTEWFNNTIHNYIYTIIYKLDKAKFIIPRMINFIREFDKEILKNKFDKELDEIPVWIWLFWLPVLFENFNYYQNKEEKNDFFFYILKKVADKYKQMFYYPYIVYNKIIREKNMTNSGYNINKKYDELFNIVSSDNKYSHFIDKIEIIINELKKKEENNRENSLNSILTLGENNTFRMDNINNLKEFFKKVATYLGSFPDLKYFTNDIISLMDSPDVTRSQLREFVIKNKYYIHNLIVTENKYEKLSKLIIEKLYNTDFSNIEIPGYFSNKMIEPTEQNIIYISKLESEYSYKLITDARAKVLIRCSNDKLMSFILENQDADKNIDKKIYIMQLLFNYIFEKNYETYKRKVKFYVPIKYFINSKLKIIEEDIYYRYNMDEIYEYCLQKRGYFPHIAYQIFEEEGKKNKLDSNYLYYSEKNNEKLFKRMCKILPQDSFKNFVHKFILTSEDILLFRKQFTTSYAINNLMNFIILDNTILKNISFNKETGLCVFNTDLTMFADNEYKELIEQKLGTPLRLTKNINYFLNVTSIYGIIPGVFNFSCKALLNKSKILKSILKICLDNNSDRIANNYMNKFKYVLNILDDKEYFNNNSIGNNNMIIEDSDNKKDLKDGNMKNIFELIDNSMNDEKLMRKSIDYEAWF